MPHIIDFGQMLNFKKYCEFQPKRESWIIVCDTEYDKILIFKNRVKHQNK